VQSAASHFDWFFVGFYGTFWARFPIRVEQSLPALSRNPVHSSVLELHGAELASVHAGHRGTGDFFDFIRVGPNRILFGLLDTTGRPRETRAVVSAAQHTFRTVGPELFARPELNEADAMMQLCLQLNQSILNTADGVLPCPAFTACYDESLGVVCYCNAGHTAGLLRDHAGVSELLTTGLPLGLFSHMISDAPMVALEPGAALLLVSRGVVQAKRKREEFGLQRVKQILQQPTKAGAKELGVSVLDQAQRFMGTAPARSDVTAIALSRNS
jgi:serine phosphatase RsbU (regulator of sigma subunit)